METIRASPMIMPGMRPPKNNLPVEIPAEAPRTTMATEGGISGPITLDEAVIPAEKDFFYPALFIIFISIAPRPPVSPTAVPDMEANIMLATTLA